MKKSLLIAFICALNYSVFAQSTVEGTYVNNFKGSHNTLERTLILNTDGTFLFHEHQNFSDRIIPEQDIYGKGTWTSENSLVYFATSKSDIDGKFTLDLSNTKARFDTKSPRDKSNSNFKTSLRFYESEVFWFKGMMLIKVE